MISVLKTFQRFHGILYPQLLTLRRVPFSTTPSDHTLHNKTADNREKTLKLSPEAQRAAWASKVIRMIQKAAPPVEIEKSLRDKY